MFTIKKDVQPELQRKFKERHMTLGDSIYIRIFKEESILEMWVKNGKRYKFYRSWAICKFSGTLGPKIREGDKQSPEGFYEVTLDQLNPDSRFHLAFNLGFPNAYDDFLGRNGSYLMVHGGCQSVGCYAMTNKGIEEIYLIVESALNNGQPHVPVHIFPFRMTNENLARHSQKPWMPFWENLKEGYDLFDKSLIPPKVFAKDGRYVFGPSRGIDYTSLAPDDHNP